MPEPLPAVATISIQYLHCESAPFRDDAVNDAVMTDEYMGLPQSWIDALWDVVEANMDNLSCARCESGGIGFCLHEDDENPNNSGVMWHELVLAREDDDGKIVALCMNCHPSINDLAEALEMPQ